MFYEALHFKKWMTLRKRYEETWGDGGPPYLRSTRREPKVGWFEYIADDGLNDCELLAAFQGMIEADPRKRMTPAQAQESQYSFEGKIPQWWKDDVEKRTRRGRNPKPNNKPEDDEQGKNQPDNESDESDGPEPVRPQVGRKGLPGRRDYADKKVPGAD